ncbi:MAG: sulfurtransferase TusA family protein [Candidatus Omnitrophota bacterium]
MYKLPQEVNDDLRKYKDSLEKVNQGTISLSRFKGIRVPWGVYSHRGGKVYMNRIRVAAGEARPPQLEALARVSSKYGDGVLHATTRQDIQIHNIRLEDTAAIMDHLKEYDLSPRGGGGNTVRNIVACPLAGVCKEEVFDVRECAIGLTEHLLRQEKSFTMPRKFKIAFSACSKDCAGVMVNDLGFFASVKGGVKGFRVFAGGGMGASSRIGQELEEFIPAGDVGYCATAVRNIFYRKGDRRNKHRNRLRFLVEDIGWEEFKRLYAEELKVVKEEERIVLRRIDYPAKERGSAELPRNENPAYKDFLDYNVIPQKQAGFFSVALRLPRGNIRAEDLSALAGLEKNFPGIEFRVTQDQNIAIVWVSGRDLFRLFERITRISGNFLFPKSLLNVVACKGASTCNLGLCDTPGLAAAAEEMIRKEFLKKRVFRDLEIKMNGCQNSCGRQPLGKVSFHGMVKRVDNRPVPFYKVFLGGRTGVDSTRFAMEIGAVPGRNIPLFLKDFFTEAETALSETDDIYSFLATRGADIARGAIERYAFVPPYLEDRTFYVDWGKDEEFSLAGLGPGECGAGVLDMIDSDLAEGEAALADAERNEYRAEHIREAFHLVTRALCIVKGRDPQSDSEAVADFKEIFVDGKIASAEYKDIRGVYSGITDGGTTEERKKVFQYTKGLLAHVRQLYGSMDSSFNFPARKGASEDKPAKAAKVYDLKGTPCPLNYVKAKLFLEPLDAGTRVEILLDEGEPIQNVPKSLENDGHLIEGIEKQGGFYKVTLKKR